MVAAIIRLVQEGESFRTTQKSKKSDFFKKSDFSVVWIFPPSCTRVVSIDLFEQNDMLIIEISDTGKGFQPVIPQKFPPTQPNRRGFGLFMAYKLVDELEFPACNQGTLVRMKIKAETTA